ncbi:MAG: hypothetical protein RLZZ267_47 [Bacillota bacterium]|jgi:stage VI sporulation protein D
MSNHQQEGIRLDLYERVQLQATAASIEALEEIELIPNIHVETRNNEASLHGDLILQGSYIAKNDHQGEYVQEIYQTIPVDITLPMSRVSNLDTIDVQVEQFDVEVSQPRTLDVTGVLSLNGIQLIHATTSSEPLEPIETVELAMEKAKPIAEPIPIPVPTPVPVPAPIPVPEPTPAPAPPQPQPEPVEIELKRSLIRIETEQRPHHTIRCCIVQKTDTWTDICNRYNKTLRELRLINRLHEDDELCDGQILIIP